MITFRIDGLKELVEELEKAQTRIPNAKQQFLAKEAGIIRGRTMKNTPVDTGLLRGSWKQTPPSSNSVTIYDNVFYAPFVEFGHRTRGGRGFVAGKHMLKTAIEESKASFAQDGKAILNSIFNG